jgi:hypothetical protein
MAAGPSLTRRWPEKRAPKRSFFDAILQNAADLHGGSATVRYRLGAMRLSALILACSLGAESFAQGFIFTFDTDSEGWQRGTNTDINSLTFDGPATWPAHWQ